MKESFGWGGVPSEQEGANSVVGGEEQAKLKEQRGHRHPHQGRGLSSAVGINSRTPGSSPTLGPWLQLLSWDPWTMLHHSLHKQCLGEPRGLERRLLHVFLGCGARYGHYTRQG